MSRKKRKKGRRKRRKKRGFPLLPILLILLFAAGTLVFLRYRETLFPPGVPEKRVVTPEKRRRGIPVTLYFSSPEGTTLVAQRIRIRENGLEERVREVVEGLIKGPGGRMTPTIPPGTRLIKVDIRKGIAYLDFSRELSERHPGGSSAEVQTVFSIVNSVVFNFPEVKKVQILIEGKRRKTLAGHIDISLPLEGERKLIGRGGKGGHT